MTSAQITLIVALSLGAGAFCYVSTLVVLSDKADDLVRLAKAIFRRERI